jgi:tRNA(His) guanylyltransferase
MKDDLGKRMKEQYEQRTRTYLPRRTYTIIRLDGKAFHTYTRGMARPFDQGLMRVMDQTTQYLCENIQGCVMGYTQSDEISLLLTDFTTIKTDAWFDGQVQKMVSVAASMATARFNEHMNINWGGTVKPKGLALFDARVFTIPDPVEVENYFVWRQKDALRNSISMHAQSLYSHNELNGKSQAEMHDMIHAKGENWDKLPNGFKRGRTIAKAPINREWEKDYPDFLKQRDILTGLIPKINYDEA